MYFRTHTEYPHLLWILHSIDAIDRVMVYKIKTCVEEKGDTMSGIPGGKKVRSILIVVYGALRIKQISIYPPIPSSLLTM